MAGRDDAKRAAEDAGTGGSTAGDDRYRGASGAASARGCREAAAVFWSAVGWGVCADPDVEFVYAESGVRYLLLVTDLLTQVAFVAHLANLMDLCFKPIDVFFFVLQETLEQLA